MNTAIFATLMAVLLTSIICYIVFIIAETRRLDREIEEIEEDIRALNRARGEA